jgi:hypothetical protein
VVLITEACSISVPAASLFSELPHAVNASPPAINNANIKFDFFISVLYYGFILCALEFCIDEGFKATSISLLIG